MSLRENQEEKQMSKHTLLEIKDLHASIAGKEILKGLNLTVKPGEVHAIMGPNGAGKSTLSNVLSGHPAYTVTSGSVTFNGKDLLAMSPEVRAREGLFMSFQYPVEIPGVSMVNFMRAAVNEGFSGGEKKRNEIFQMAMLEPRLSILDETDSGLDIDALRIVANGVNMLKTPENASIVITHYQRLLDYIVPDIVDVLVDGRIVMSGPKELVMELEEKGYDWIKAMHNK